MVSVYKRPDSEFYWFKFNFKGKRYQRPTKVRNRREAEKIEAAFRTMLANGEVGIAEQKPAPTLLEFEQSFIDFIQARHANKPETIKFYANRLKRLLEWDVLRETRLDLIDEALIERYVVMRRKKVEIVAVNRELATLRRILHIAVEWKLIRRVPKVRLLPGETSRDFVLSHKMERAYLEACPPLLRDAATILLDTGLRLGEALSLRWIDVHTEPAGSARYGWVQVREGKSANARRTVPLTARASRMLTAKQGQVSSIWIFPGDSLGRPMLGTSLAHIHAKVCRPGSGKKRVNVFPEEFVLHSLRHTCLTRLGEAGADAFTIMKLAGHSSVTVSQRYVHPTGEQIQLVFDRLEKLNQLGATSG
ncbi:MAG: site-specific integrase [Acidobacteriaceae bacterium]